ncbi:MAG TPA: hypothetical protein VKG21_22395 [Casimicrobiaceae bacterium]|nr:hypothetical protein [Casimicrobiaceae bacterium]
MIPITHDELPLALLTGLRLARVHLSSMPEVDSALRATANGESTP